MIFQKTKFSHKFYIKISLLGDEPKLNKLSTIYNQLNVEDSSSFDHFLQDQFLDIDTNTSTLNILQPVVRLVLWKRGIKSNTFFRLKFFSSEKLFKHTLQRYKYLLPFFYQTTRILSLKRFVPFKIYWRVWNRHYLFTQSFLQSSFHDSELGPYFCKTNFDYILTNLEGYLYSYVFRSKMLGRRINFRDKTLRKKIEIL